MFWENRLNGICVRTYAKQTLALLLRLTVLLVPLVLSAASRLANAILRKSYVYVSMPIWHGDTVYSSHCSGKFIWLRSRFG